MQTTQPCLLIPNSKVVRVRTTHDLYALFPHGVARLLLVLDPANEPERVLVIAVGLGERWDTQITLVHGGQLVDPVAKGKHYDQDAAVDLLCLSWQVKGSYPDVSISLRVPRSRSEIFAEASERKADVIMIPEALAVPFLHRGVVESEDENSALSPCPVVIIPPSWIDVMQAQSFRNYRFR